MYGTIVTLWITWFVLLITLLYCFHCFHNRFFRNYSCVALVFVRVDYSNLLIQTCFQLLDWMWPSHSKTIQSNCLFEVLFFLTLAYTALGIKEITKQLISSTLISSNLSDLTQLLTYNHNKSQQKHPFLFNLLFIKTLTYFLTHFRRTHTHTLMYNHYTICN